ncbi:hypothetical protein PIB30_030352 [Stylosanthes scabra]|uniref:Uncharacterized protein n=1 Tax=Stylosanthes scabra TaxID=79078 RepID=A0ABU6VB20_9FABA|nr:hypothetical protein [Stylosanthes scabra]
MGLGPEKLNPQNSLHLSEFYRRRAGAPPPSRGRAMSLSWALRNGVVRAHDLGHAGALPTETSVLRKGGRGRAILRARAHVNKSGLEIELLPWRERKAAKVSKAEDR